MVVPATLREIERALRALQKCQLISSIIEQGYLLLSSYLLSELMQKEKEKETGGHEGEAEFVTAIPHRHVTYYTILQWLLVVITGGIFGLVLLWWPKCRFWFRPHCLPAQATCMLIGSINVYDTLILSN